MIEGIALHCQHLSSALLFVAQAAAVEGGVMYRHAKQTYFCDMQVGKHHSFLHLEYNSHATMLAQNSCFLL